MYGHIPQPPPERRGSWFSRLSSLQQAALSFGIVFVVLGLVSAVVFAAVAIPRGQQTPLSEQDVQELREDAPNGFVRQEDGGTFESPKQLVQALEANGVHCVNPRYFTSAATDDPMVECSTGVARVSFVVGKPGDDTLVQRRTALPESQALTSLLLMGQNWVLSTACDYSFGNQVRRAIGGEYLRKQFIRPNNC